MRESRAPRQVHLTAAKAEAGSTLAPGHPLRVLMEHLPDSLEEAQFDALAPALVRLARERSG